MVETKELIVSMRQNAIDYALISQERTAKLELLIHLLHNSTRPIILCGAKGIGKSTLLTVFQQQMTDAEPICLIRGKADLTMEQIQQHVLALCPVNQSNEHFFAQLEKQNKKLILIIDNAGVLIPHLLNALIQYAAQVTVLKLVFVLTHDELAIKTYSDTEIEHCHVIEIPPLSVQQCGDFLQHLALKALLPIPITQVTDTIINHVYQQTQGIPAAIIEQLPLLARTQIHKKQGTKLRLLWLLLVIVLGIIVFLAISHKHSLLTLLTAK